MFKYRALNDWNSLELGITDSSSRYVALNQRCVFKFNEIQFDQLLNFHA